LFLSQSESRDVESRRGITIFPTLLHPKSFGEITLATGNPYDHPNIDPHYLESPDDVETLLQGKVYCATWNSVIPAMVAS